MKSSNNSYLSLVLYWYYVLVRGYSYAYATHSMYTWCRTYNVHQYLVTT